MNMDLTYTQEVFDEYLNPESMRALATYCGLRAKQYQGDENWFDAATGEWYCAEWNPNRNPTQMSKVVQHFMDRRILLQLLPNPIANAHNARFIIVINPENMPMQTVSCNGYTAESLCRAVTGAAVIALATLKAIDR